MCFAFVLWSPFSVEGCRVGGSQRTVRVFRLWGRTDLLLQRARQRLLVSHGDLEVALPEAEGLLPARLHPFVDGASRGVSEM